MADRPQNHNLRRGGPGRKKGSRNKRTEAIEAVSRGLLEDPAYRESLAKRLKAGKAPHMETLLHYYAYGKPIDRHEVSGPQGNPLPIQYYLPQKDEPPQ